MARVMAVALDVMEAPWEWGYNDCCASACEVFRRLYGIDPMAHLRGTYSTERDALRIIRSHGGFSEMASILAIRSGLRPCADAIGAIGVYDKSLVICARPGVWLGKTVHGMTTVRSTEAAYHVGL
jgi:hypothetical protein